jgi:hypothetical protein
MIMMYIGPDIAVPVSVCACIAVTALGSKWIAYKRNSAAGPGALEALERRLSRVEVALDDLTGEIGKIGEGQQFLTKVLAERSQQALPVETSGRLKP